MSVTITQRPTYHGYYAKNTVPKFIITTDEAITATLTMQGHTFTASYVPDFDGKIEIDFSSLYGDYIKTQMPNGSNQVVNQNASLITCEVSFSGSTTGNIAYPLGYPWIWYVFNANLKSATAFETWSQQNFLTNQPIEKHTNYEAPEWLTYLVLGNGGTNLKVRFYKKTGGNVDALIRSNNIAGCFTVDVSYKRLIQLANVLPSTLLGYYDVILFDSSSNEMCRQRFVFEERTGCEKYFLFVNALGGIDTLICKGENVLNPEVTHNIGRFNDKYEALDDTDDRRVWEQNIGMFPNRYRDWIYELMTDKQAAAIFDAKEETYLEIVITESDPSVSDFGQLASSTFSYILAETVNAISDSERALDRSFHQSVADEAEALEDLTTEVSLQMKSAQGGGFETDEETLPATKLYVDWLIPSNGTSEKIYILIDGKEVDDFTPGTDASPIIVTKGASDPIQFVSSDTDVTAIVINYYPVTIQSV